MKARIISNGASSRENLDGRGDGRGDGCKSGGWWDQGPNFEVDAGCVLL